MSQSQIELTTLSFSFLFDFRTLEIFFGDHIDFILLSLVLPSTGGTDNERINKLATKSGALKLLGSLYSRQLNFNF